MGLFIDLLLDHPGIWSFLLLMIFLIPLMVYIGRKIKRYDPLHVNSVFQNLIEMMFEWFYEITHSMLGEKYAKKFTPLTMTMFLSIFLGNAIALFGFKEVAINFHFPFTWAISMFIFWNVYGLYKIGIKNYIGKYTNPFVIMAPLQIVSQLVKPLSLMMRMFGNIMAGFVIMGFIWSIPEIVANISLFAGIVITPLVVIFGTGLSFYFNIFGPFLQAIVFTYLTLSNFAQFIVEEE